MTPELIDWQPGVVIQGDDYPADYEVQVVSDLDSVIQRFAPEDVIDFYTLPGDPAEFQSALLKRLGDTETSESDATATFTICTNLKNRHGNKHQLGVNRFGQGMRFQEWSPHPNVLWAHGKDGVTMPLGVAEDRDGKLLLQASTAKVNSTCRFNQHFHFAMDIFRAVNEKFIRMSSVGFDPVKALYLPAQRQQQSAAGSGVMTLRDDRPGFEFVETILREWSILPVGADPGAMRQCYSDGKVGGEKIHPMTKRVFEKYAEPKPTIGRGFDAALLQQSIDNLTVVVNRLVEQSTPPAPVVEETSETPAIVEQTIVTDEEPAITTTVDDLEATFAQQLAEALKNETQRLLTPVQNQLSQLQKDFDYASGKVR